MPGRLVVAAFALLCALPLPAEEVLYQIDLVPSGKSISRGLPTLRGAQYVYHEFPGGTLVSVRKSSVKTITKMSPKAAAAVNPRTRLVRIGDLAFQGPRSGGSGGGRSTTIDRARAAVAAANAGTASRTGQ